MFPSDTIKATDAYLCSVKGDKDACARMAISAAGGGPQGAMAYDCATKGDTDECMKVVLTLATQEACVATGPAALACVYIAPVVVDAIYPYAKSLFIALTWDIPGGFLDAIGVDLSGLMAHEIFNGDNYIIQMVPPVVDQWKQAVAGVEAMWHAAREAQHLPDAPVSIDANLVNANVVETNHGTVGDMISSSVVTTQIVRSKTKLNAREALLSWLYDYNEGWSKSKVTNQYSSDLNGHAQVWTVNQPDGHQPEEAGVLMGPLALMSGGFPEDCNSSCRTSLIFGAQACWRYRLDALACALVAMAQVITKQVTEEKEGAHSTLGTAVRIGTGAAGLGGAGYGLYRGLLWLIPKIFRPT